MAKKKKRRSHYLSKEETEYFNYIKEAYEKMMINVPVSIIIVDSHFKVLYANRNFYIKTKKKHDNVVGANINAIFPPYFVQGIDLQDKLEKVIRYRKPEEGTVSFRIRTYNYRMIPIPREDDMEVILILDDVTEEIGLEEKIRQIERHLTSVVESASDLVFSADTRGRILTWNVTAEKITGHSREELEGRTLVTLFTKRDRGAIRSIFNEIKKGRWTDNYECDLRKADGSIASISWGFGGIRNDKGKVIGLMGVGRDLTERKEMELKLLQTERLASLGQLSAGVAHEINNPLGIIATTVDTLLGRERKDQFKITSLERIKAQVERSARIVDNLLNFSRPKKPDMRPLEASEVLEETLSLIEHQLKLDNIEVIREFTPNLPKIMGDRSQLQQVFMNMIQNAHNAMPNGGKLYIVTKPDDSSVSFIQVVFSDLGVGISHKDLPHIFDPFYTTREISGGTGLGLSVSYSIVQRHNGSISVESTPGKGTTFFIKLPISK